LPQISVAEAIFRDDSARKSPLTIAARAAARRLIVKLIDVALDVTELSEHEPQRCDHSVHHEHAKHAPLEAAYIRKSLLVSKLASRVNHLARRATPQE
jgi:hypothetical protein